MHRAAPWFALVFLTAACSSTHAPRGAEPVRTTDLPRSVDVRNFKVLASDIAGGGQPSFETLEGLPEKGYSTVINLRAPGEYNQAEEARVVEASGLYYVNIPVTGSRFSLKEAAQLQEALDAAPSGSILIHCGSGTRVGALWGLYRGLSEGLSPEEALAVAREAGYGSHGLDDEFESELVLQRPR